MCLNNPFKGIVYLFKFTCTQRKLKAEQNHPFQEFDIVVLLFRFYINGRCSCKKYKVFENNYLV